MRNREEGQGQIKAEPEGCISYWVGQYVHSGFPKRCYGKTQQTFWPNPT